MQYVIRWGLALLLLAPVSWAQGEQDAADTALEAAQVAEAAVKKAQTELKAKPDDADLQEAAEQSEATFAKALDTLEEKVKAASDAGAEITKHEIYLNENGEIQLSASAAFGLVEKWTIKGKDWVIDSGPGVLMKILGFLLILIVFKFLAGMAAKITRKTISASRMKVSDLLKNFFVTVIQKLIFFIGLVIALGHLGVDTGPLLAGIGVLGFVIGFALQDTLGNFASGIMILLYRPYDIGDVIDGAGTRGKVSAMTLVSTTLLTPDNQIVIVPNSSIWGSTITNVTANNTRRVDLTFGVGYGDDLDKSEEMIRAVVTAHPLVLASPEPQIKVSNLGESSVDFVVRPWCKTSDYWDVFFDLNKQLKQRADADGISIPFPQRDVHIHQVGGGDAG